MAMLSSRLEKLEDKFPKEKKLGRVIRLVANDEDEAEAHRMLEAEGFDPENGDIAIIRLIAPAPGKTLPPRVPSITIKHQHESRIVPEPK